MASDPHWAIVPATGLGPLRLGMDARQVEQFDPVFGRVLERQDELASIEPVLKSLEPFADSVPGIRENMEAMRRNAESSFSEFRPQGSPVLRYKEGLLIEILIPATCRSTHLDGFGVFSEQPYSVLKHLSAINKAARFLHPEVMFDRLCLKFLWFAFQDEFGNVNFSVAGIGQPDERLIKIVTKEDIKLNRKHYKALNL